MQNSKRELERIEQVYVNRERKQLKDLYTYFNQGNLFIIQDREKKLLDLLAKYGMDNLNDKKILFHINNNIIPKLQDDNIISDFIKMIIGI